MAHIDRLREFYLYRLFRFSVFLKGVLSVAEVVAGIAALFIPPATIGNAIVVMSQNELAEEPGSFIASHALPLAQQFALTPQSFVAIYLLSRGLIKLGLVFALLRNKLWAYPAALAVLGLFMLYQIYKIALTHSDLLIVLTVFDAAVMGLIAHEYRLVRKHIDPAVVR